MVTDFNLIDLFSLSADARIQPLSTNLDIVWDIRLNKDPNPISINSSFGLQTASYELFPIIRQNGFSIDIENVRIEEYYPNYLRVAFDSIQGLDASLELWIPDSKSIAMQITTQNHNPEPLSFSFGWISVLSQINSDERIMKYPGVIDPYLSGKLDDFKVFLFGKDLINDEITVRPALISEITLAPGHKGNSIWLSGVGEDNLQKIPFLLGKLQKSWFKEMTKLKNLNANMISIETGDPSWDLIIALSQLSRISYLTNTSEAGNIRTIDRSLDMLSAKQSNGHTTSRRDELTIFDLFYFIDSLLISDPEIAVDLFNNYFANTKDNGFLRIFLSSHEEKSDVLAPPLAASIVWNIFKHTSDKTFLERHYSQLVKFHDLWASDIARSPTSIDYEITDHTQILLDNYLSEFDFINNISILELKSPTFLAFLYLETLSLYKISVTTNHLDYINQLAHLFNQFRFMLGELYDPVSKSYEYKDRRTGHSKQQENITQIVGNQTIDLSYSLTDPVNIRLIVTNGKSSSLKEAVFFIKGRNEENLQRVEKIQLSDFSKMSGSLIAASKETYNKIDQIEVVGVYDDTITSIIIPGTNHKNSTLFLPLYAKALNAATAEEIVSEQFSENSQFWGEYGIPVTPFSNNLPREISFPLNSFIGKGLLRCGFFEEGYELAKRILTGIKNNLSIHGSLIGNFDPSSGSCEYPKRSISTIPPTGFFLEAFGVKIYNQHKVKINGTHFHDSEIIIKQGGLTIRKTKTRTSIIFPNGTTAFVKADEIKTIDIHQE